MLRIPEGFQYIHGCTYCLSIDQAVVHGLLLLPINQQHVYIVPPPYIRWVSLNWEMSSSVVSCFPAYMWTTNHYRKRLCNPASLYYYPQNVFQVVADNHTVQTKTTCFTMLLHDLFNPKLPSIFHLSIIFSSVICLPVDRENQNHCKGTPVMSFSGVSTLSNNRIP